MYRLPRDDPIDHARRHRAPPSRACTEATRTSKGQTTIPKVIRDSLQVQPGDRVTFTLMPDGVVLMRVKSQRAADLAGLLHRKGRKPVPIEQLSR